MAGFQVILVFMQCKSHGLIKSGLIYYCKFVMSVPNHLHLLGTEAVLSLILNSKTSNFEIMNTKYASFFDILGKTSNINIQTFIRP